MKSLPRRASVDDVGKSVSFRSALFGAEPLVLKGNYGKLMVADRRVNFAISRTLPALPCNFQGETLQAPATIKAI